MKKIFSEDIATVDAADIGPLEDGYSCLITENKRGTCPWPRSSTKATTLASMLPVTKREHNGGRKRNPMRVFGYQIISSRFCHILGRSMFPLSGLKRNPMRVFMLIGYQIISSRFRHRPINGVEFSLVEPVEAQKELSITYTPDASGLAPRTLQAE
ncbi:hypothetical protein AKJ16_DCAP24759 [Drosera capensis]